MVFPLSFPLVAILFVVLYCGNVVVFCGLWATMAEGSGSSLHSRSSLFNKTCQWAPFCCWNALECGVVVYQYGYPHPCSPFSVLLSCSSLPSYFDSTFQSSPFRNRASIIQKMRKLSQAIPPGSPLRSFPSEEPSAFGDVSKESTTTETLPVVSMQIGKIKEQLQDLMKIYSIYGVLLHACVRVCGCVGVCVCVYALQNDTEWRSF